MIDVNHEISSTERQVGRRTLEAGDARVVTIERVYDTSLEDLWDACTNPERIPRWFLPVSGDLRVGGHYAFEGNASGTISRCEPPHRVDATWEYGGQTSWVELRLVAEPDGRARFALEHIAHVSDDLWAQFGPGAVGIGWDLAALGLRLHFASGGAQVDRGEFEAWHTSDAGREYTRLISDDWTAASIAAGTNPDEARAAGGRATGFYTGQPAA